MYGALAFRILVDTSSYPYAFFGFKSLIISYISLVTVCFNLIFVHGQVNALCWYFSGSVVPEVRFSLFTMFSSIILSTIDKEYLLKLYAIS